MIEDVSTVAGRISKTDTDQDIHTLVYEVEERLEAVTSRGEPEILISTGGEYLASDFAAILAFVWQVTCSTNIDVVRRLTRGFWSQAHSAAPSKYVERIFNPEVVIKPADVGQLPTFLEQLIGLERAQYREVIRAIRRYNVALQRLGDDLPLAYLLLVASIESLAQKFDKFRPIWEDLDQRKRRAIESALDGAAPAVSEQVKAAVLEIEYVALGRRYREFALSRLRPQFFREDAAQYEGPAKRRDLPKALAGAYRLRSELIHRLGELPRMLTAVPTRSDVTDINGSPLLTFNGLARIAREVIIAVVAKAPKVEKEALDYRSELPNTLTAKLAPRYWIWRADGLKAATANQYLSGFLGELAPVLRGNSDAKLTDIRTVLQRIEELAPTLDAHSRLPLLTLYHLFHRHVSREWWREGAEAFLQPYEDELNSPSVPSLVGHVVSGAQVYWSIREHEQQIEIYFAERFHRLGLRIDPLFETAILLNAAQRHLLLGSVEKAAGYVAQAVDHMPGLPALVEIESRIAAQSVSPEEVQWQRILVPQQRSLEPAGGNGAA